MTDINVWAAIGFILAAYAVVGNDALQTLGTFINSNGRLHWTVLFAFAATVLVVTFTYGFIQFDGDPSFGRLANAKKYPPIETVQWFHAVPALALLLLTRLGIPVSTSFMVLALVATMSGLGSMMQKSLIGYGLAFAVGLVLYLILAKTLEAFFVKTKDDEFRWLWVVGQWLSTTWLWAVWLMQDFANIFAFLPRKLNAYEAFAGCGVIVVMLAFTFANQGGPVQKILKSKSSVTDIRSATVIDFTFAGLLFYFKELNDVPMSTTWVFLGLIAGREYAFSFLLKRVAPAVASRVALTDICKAYIGLVVSVDLARGLPALVQGTPIWEGTSSMVFILVLNGLLVPVGLFLSRKDRVSMAAAAFSLAAASAAFFTFPIS